MKSFEASIRIQANAERVWKILADVFTWPMWNPTVVAVFGKGALGEKISVRAQISPNRAFDVKVTTFDPPRQMVWTSGMEISSRVVDRADQAATLSRAVEFRSFFLS